MIIYPGETATFDFTVPFTASTLSKAVITFNQDGDTVAEAETTDITAVENTVSNVSCSLSQKDSLKLKNNINCYIQINLLTVDGSRIVGEPVMVNVGAQHYEKILR